MIQELISNKIREIPAPSLDAIFLFISKNIEVTKKELSQYFYFSENLAEIILEEFNNGIK